MLLTCSALLCACNTGDDIANLGGETVTSETVSQNGGGYTDGVYAYFIDNCRYDHFSYDEYSAHILKENTQPITDVKNNYAEDAEWLCANPRNRFTFENCEIVQFPDVEELSAVTFNENNLTCDEAWALIQYWLDKWELTDKIDLDENVRDSNRVVKVNDKIVHALAKSVWDENDGSGFYLNDRGLCYIQMFGSGVGVLSHGVISDYVEAKTGAVSDKTADPYYIAGTVETGGSLQEMRDRSYELLDGKTVTVGEASEALNGFYTFSDGMDYEIYGVNVIKVEDRYVYEFLTRRVCRDIPLTVTHYGHISDYVHSYVMDGDMGKVYVADDSGVYAFFGAAGRPLIKELCEPQTNILGLKDAMQTVYGIMSMDYQCNIDRIELCMGYYRSAEEGSTGMAFLPPCWEFTGHSDVSGKTIKIDVDVLTGEIGFKEYGMGND